MSAAISGVIIVVIAGVAVVTYGAALPAMTFKGIVITGAIYVGSQALADIAKGSVSGLGAYAQMAILGSAVGIINGVTGSIPIVGQGLLVRPAVAFADGAMTSIVDQLVRTGKLDGSLILRDSAFSFATDLFLWLGSGLFDDVLPARVTDGGGGSNVISNKFPYDPPDAGYKVSYVIEDGKIKISDWQGQRYYDFIINQNGELMLGSKHSYLADNNDVLAAGTIKIDSQGYVRRIDNLSGHYQPTPIQTEAFPELFNEAGVRTKNTWLEIYDIKSDASGLVYGIEIVNSTKLGG